MSIVAQNPNPATAPPKKRRTRAHSRITLEWITLFEFETMVGYGTRKAMELTHEFRALGMRTIGKGVGLRINLADARKHLDRISRET